VNIIPYIIMLVASYVISYALQPKPQTPKPASQDEFDFPQADEGTPQAVVFGDAWLSDWMVLTVGNYRTAPVKTKQGK